jgi:hypothetical protein
MPGNIWLILLARMSSVVTACIVAAAEFEQKRASTYMICCLGSIEIQVRIQRSAWISDRRMQGGRVKKDHAPA